MSREFQNRPATSFERALHLIEHVARHKSAKFIRNPSQNIKLNKNIIFRWFKILFQTNIDFWIVSTAVAFVMYKIFIFILKIQMQLIPGVAILSKSLTKHFKTFEIKDKDYFNKNYEQKSTTIENNERLTAEALTIPKSLR